VQTLDDELKAALLENGKIRQELAMQQAGLAAHSQRAQVSAHTVMQKEKCTPLVQHSASLPLQLRRFSFRQSNDGCGCDACKSV
jgi:hypothetical protein